MARAVAFWCLLLSLPAAAEYLTPDAPRSLMIEGGQTLRFSVPSDKVEYALYLRRDGAQAAIRFFSGGRLKLELASFGTTEGEIWALLPAKNNEPRELEFFSVNEKSVAESFLVELKTSSEIDIARLRAIELTGLGLDQHFRQFLGHDGDRRAARDYLRKALDAWVGVHDSDGSAIAAFELAIVEWGLGDTRAAAGHLEAADEYWARNNHIRRASTWNLLGLLSWQEGDVLTARGHYERALRQRIRDGNNFHASQIENNLGLLALELGDFNAADSRFRGTLKKAQGQLYDLISYVPGQGGISTADLVADLRSGYLDLALTALNNFALLQDTIGLPNSAIRLWQTYLSLSPYAVDRRIPGFAANSLGSIYLRQGEIEKSLLHLGMAMDSFVNIGDPAGIALVHASLGNYFHTVGQLDKAFGSFQKSLEYRTVERAAGKRVQTLLDLTRTLVAQSRIEKALEMATQAIDIAQNLESPTIIAEALVVAARLATRQSDFENSRVLLDRAKALIQDKIHLRTRAEIAYSDGELALAQKRFESAKIHYTATLKLTKQGWHAELQAKAQARISRTERELGNLNESLQSALIAVSTAEELRARVRSPRARSGMMAAVRQAYFEQVAALIALGSPLEAWVASQQARARTLWEKQELRIGTTTKGSTALMEKHSTLRSRFSALADHLATDLDPKSDDFGRLQDLVSELDLVENEIAKLAGNGQSAVQFNVAAAKDFVASLDRDTMLIEHLVGESESIGFLVSSEGVSAWKIVSRRELRPSLVAALNSVSGPANRVDTEAMRLLSKNLLSPLAANRHGKLIIIPDAGFHRLPFGVLPDPSTGYSLPLISQRKITLVDSVPTLDNTKWQAPRTVSVVANPTVTTMSLGSRTGLVRSALGDAPSLPFAEDEARNISALAPNANVLLNQQATLRNVLDKSFWNSDVLHFATHGLTNMHLPELAGILLLNDQKESVALRAIDLQQLSLSAHMVVLSACQSGVGKEIKGEGVFSLSRAFRAAGATSTVSSLWRVEDRSTSVLMKHFYLGIFKQDLKPAAALQSAQLATMANPGTRHPYYWAGFIFEK